MYERSMKLKGKIYYVGSLTIKNNSLSHKKIYDSKCIFKNGY